jgi:DNA-binding YbaB/EbfC family protein
MFDGIDLCKIDLTKMIGEVQNIATKAKEDGEKDLFVSSVGGGMIELSINGNSEVVDLKIDNELLDDKDSLQTLLIGAINDCLKQSDENKKKLALNMMSGMNSLAK